MKKKSKVICTKHVEYAHTTVEEAHLIPRKYICRYSDNTCSIRCKNCRPVKITYEFIRRIPR